MSDGTPNTDKDTAGQGDGGNDKKGFTEEEQNFINGLIKDKYTEAYSKATTKISAESKAEMDDLRQQIAELKVDKGRKKEDDKGDDVSELKAELDSLRTEVRSTKELASREKLNAIAADMGAINSNQAAVLMSSSIKYDGDKTVILNAEGQARRNGEGEKMTVKEFVKEFLNENPYLVKPSNKGGSGSQSAKGGGKGGDNIIKRGDYDKLSPIKQSEFIKAGGTLVD